MSLSAAFSSIRAASQAANVRAARDLAIFERLGSDTVNLIKVQSAQALVPMIRSMLLANYKASGLGAYADKKYQPQHQLEAACRGAVVDCQANGFVVMMPTGLKYKNGDVYAAAGSFRYGAVRAPREMRAILDTVKGGTDRGYGYQKGHAIFGYKKASIMGEKMKRSIKRSYLQTGNVEKGLSKREMGAFERLSDKRLAKGKESLGIGHGLSVISPRPPWWEFTPDQLKQLEQQWFLNIRDRLRARKVKVA